MSLWSPNEPLEEEEEEEKEEEEEEEKEQEEKGGGGKRRRRRRRSSTMPLGRKSIPQVNNAIGLHTVGESLLREEGWEYGCEGS